MHPPVSDDQISVDFPSKANNLLSLKELVEVGCYWEDPRPDSTVRVRETRHALSPVFVRPLTGRGGELCKQRIHKCLPLQNRALHANCMLWNTELLSLRLFSSLCREGLRTRD